MKKSFTAKVQRKLWREITGFLQKKRIYPLIYKSYWHQFTKKSSFKVQKKGKTYFTAVPNPGAGIGHQMANWIAGYHFANLFSLDFAHTAFSSAKWEYFLGFGENQTNVEELLKKGYKKILLPRFDEKKPKDIELIKRIIISYNNKDVVFVAELDQFHEKQCGLINVIKEKFYNAQARNNDKLLFCKEYFNVAIHVRRGDIITVPAKQNTNLLMRFQDNTYFEKVLLEVISNIKTTKPVKIFLFSQGEEEDFPEFRKFENIIFCLDMPAMDCFLHMVYADLLITSKSSFSYKPALLNQGMKISPKNFWHGYPVDKDWILADDNGNFDSNLLSLRINR